MLQRFLGSLLLTLAAGAGQIVSPPAPAQVYPNPSQSPLNPSAKRYPVSGSVVNALTGAPVPRALVRLQSSEPAQVLTGDDGHFEFKDVPEGSVFLFAQRPGFGQNTARMLQQKITVSASTPSVQLKLVPQSSLRGRVLNNDGEPVEGIQVQVLRRQVVGGISNWMAANASITDETGAFLIEDLLPGAYLVHTSAHSVFTSASSIVVDGRHFPDLYRAQYYPNAPDRASAQPLQIQPGTEAQADFTVSPVPTYSATGSLATNEPGYAASCETSEGEVVSSAFRADPRNGQFTIRQLPSGACTLRVHSGQRAGGSYGEVPINIGAADVTGLQLTLEPLSDIPLVVSGGSNSADASPGKFGSNIQLIPRQQQVGIFSRFPILQKRGDSQVFASVMPGSYHLSAQAFGGTCIGSVTSGSVDLLRSDLTVFPGSSSAHINVTLRTDCGSITAKLDGPGATDLVSVVAVLEGAPALAKMQAFTGGNLQLSDLTPGDYTIYIAPDLSNFAYADPEALKGVQGQKVTVGPNAKLNIQLQLPNAAVEAQ